MGKGTDIITGPAGTSVEVLGPAGLRYTDGERVLLVDSEVLAGQSGMMVYRDSIRRWEPPDDAYDISDAERERIVEDIRALFRRKGFEIDVI